MKILFVVYDNGSYDHTFPMGYGAIGGVLIKEGRGGPHHLDSKSRIISVLLSLCILI
jgi:hypothetical protein